MKIPLKENKKTIMQRVAIHWRVFLGRDIPLPLDNLLMPRH